MNPTKFISKSGQEIQIRLGKVEDARALMEMKLEYLKNTDTIPLYQKEYPTDVKEEEALIERLTKERNSVLLIAEHQGEMIGNIDLNGNQRLKLFHTGVIGMGIREKWRGKGIGYLLLEEVIKWSRSNPFITLLWLEVYDSNQAGKALYRKCGFDPCGTMKGFFCEDNTYIDKITMVKHLK